MTPGQAVFLAGLLLNAAAPLPGCCRPYVHLTHEHLRLPYKATASRQCLAPTSFRHPSPLHHPRSSAHRVPPPSSSPRLCPARPHHSPRASRACSGRTLSRARSSPSLALPRAAAGPSSPPLSVVPPLCQARHDRPVDLHRILKPRRRPCLPSVAVLAATLSLFSVALPLLAFERRTLSRRMKVPGQEQENQRVTLFYSSALHICVTSMTIVPAYTTRSHPDVQLSYRERCEDMSPKPCLVMPIERSEEHTDPVTLDGPWIRRAPDPEDQTRHRLHALLHGRQDPVPGGDDAGSTRSPFWSQ